MVYEESSKNKQSDCMVLEVTLVTFMGIMGIGHKMGDFWLIVIF